MNNTLLVMIIGHFVGDFLLQNDWMAEGKKRSPFICMVHSMVVSAIILVFLALIIRVRLPIGLFTCLWLTHFVQDDGSFDLIRRWMRLIGQNKFMQPPLGPWSIIVVDQVWHLLILFILWRIFFL